MGGLFSRPESINPNTIDLSHYTFHRVLGKGGYGTVTVVEHSYNDALDIESTHGSTNQQLYVCKKIHKYKLVNNVHAYRSTLLERSIGIQLTQQSIISSIPQYTVPLYHCLQTSDSLYLFYQLIHGGDLRYYIDNNICVSDESQLIQYCAELIVVLNQIHELGLIYHDLKPDNIMIDSTGHIVLIDLGLCVHESDTCNILPSEYVRYRGTLGYMAPEILSGSSYTHCIDYYSLGVTLYELVHGSTILPNITDIHSNNPIIFTDRMSNECHDFITRLLDVNPRTRLGANSIDELKFHVWFKNIDWCIVEQKQLSVHYIPSTDTANCDYTYDLEDQLLGDVELEQHTTNITDEQQLMFSEWNYNLHVNQTLQQYLIQYNQQLQSNIYTKFCSYIAQLYTRCTQSSYHHKHKSRLNSTDSTDNILNVIVVNG